MLLPPHATVADAAKDLSDIHAIAGMIDARLARAQRVAMTRAAKDNIAEARARVAQMVAIFDPYFQHITALAAEVTADGQ